MSVALLSGPAAPTMLHSFISGIGECAAPEDLAALRIGLPLRLRRAVRPSRGCALEILAPTGRPLGRLPREDAAALEALGLDPDRVRLWVSGILPAFQRPRVQITIALPVQAEEVAPAA